MYSVFSTKSDPDTGERLLNAFLRPVQEATNAQIVGRSGLVTQFSLGGEIRAQVTHKGAYYVIAAGILWRIGRTAENLGTLPDGPSRMVSGSTQIAITVNGAYYVWDSVTEELSKIDPGVLEYVTDVEYLDGYYILVGSYGGRDDCIQITTPHDATELNALDFAFAEGSDDAIIACIVDHSEFWAIGATTIERYYNDGGDFPLQRYNGGAFERGCHSAATVVKADNRVFWVGEDRVVYVGSGGELSVISPRWIDEILRGADILGAFTFRDRGTPFYAIRVHGRATLVYDITTGLWHERSSGLDGFAWVACSAHGHNGRDYIGTVAGDLCFQDKDVYRDAGELFAMEAQSAPIIMPEKRVISILQVLYGGGSQRVTTTQHTRYSFVPAGSSGLVTSDGKAVSLTGDTQEVTRYPQVMLQISKDGRKWGREKWKNLPKIGTYSKPVKWRGLGQSDHWQARIRITDEVNRDIRGVFYE